MWGTVAIDRLVTLTPRFTMAAARRSARKSPAKKKHRELTKAERSAAAKRGARTRAKNAEKRSIAAKKAAATRKRNARKGR